MKNILVFIIISLMSVAAYSSEFEVYGLKSGITKTEFYELTKCQEFIDTYNTKNPPSRYSPAKELSYCLQAPYNSGNTGEYEYANLSFFAIEPSLSLAWTHDDKLWRVTATYEKASGILEGISYAMAVTQAHPGMDVKESSVRGEYGTKEYLTVHYIDDALSDNSVNHYLEIYLTKINNKK
jgi:hypothetical protein